MLGCSFCPSPQSSLLASRLGFLRAAALVLRYGPQCAQVGAVPPSHPPSFVHSAFCDERGKCFTWFPSLPGIGKKNCFRLLWVLSASALHRAEHRRYLSASRQPRYKCRDWYFNVLQRCSDQGYRGYTRMSRGTFQHVLGLLRQHAADLFVPRRGAQQLALEIQLALTLY